MPRVVVDGVLNGVWYHFPNGGEPVRHPSLHPENNEHFIELRIVGAAAHDRSTERLARTDLSRVIFVYGTADEQVGRLSDRHQPAHDRRGTFDSSCCFWSGSSRPAAAERGRGLYVYGTADTVVARLTPAEVGFLESAGSRIIAVRSHLFPVVDPAVVQQIIDALQE